jgi:hypothetical protein
VPIQDCGDPVADSGVIPTDGGNSAPAEDSGTAPRVDTGTAPIDDSGTAPRVDAGTAPVDDSGTAPVADSAQMDASRVLVSGCRLSSRAGTASRGWVVLLLCLGLVLRRRRSGARLSRRPRIRGKRR